MEKETIMGPFTTERLILRRFQVADLDAIWQQIYQDRAVFTQYSGIGGDFGAVEERVRHYAYQPVHSEFGRLAVTLKEGGQLIGQVHLDPHAIQTANFDGDNSPFFWVEVELAFAFGKEFWGKGYAYEACLPMIHYAFNELHLPRLVGGAMADNERSIALHRRLGYRIVENPNKDDPVGLITILDNPRRTG